MDTQSSEAELERIKAKAISIVEAGLGLGRPVLVSQLGIALGEDRYLLKQLLHGKKLVDFVRDHMSDRFELVLVGRHANVHAILPRDAQKNIQIVTPGDPAASKTLLATRHGSRYDYHFWSAFSVPLEEGTKRYLDFDGFLFKNLPAAEEGPPGMIEITADLVAPKDLVDPDERNAFIQKSISTWLARNGLPKENFLAKQKSASDAPKTGSSVLEQVLSALDHRQLHSTSLPLDVVATLLRKRT